MCFGAIYTLQPSRNAHAHTHTRTNTHTHTPRHTYLQAFLIGPACKNILTNISKKLGERKGQTLPNPNIKSKGRKEEGSGRDVCWRGWVCGGGNVIACVCVCVCVQKKGGNIHFSKAQESCMPPSVCGLLLCICRGG